MIGLKENVIIGKLIPAGTGMRKYRDVKLDTELDMDDEITLEDFEELSEETVEESVVEEICFAHSFSAVRRGERN